MNTAHIDVIYSFLIKNVRFTCVCAFFFVLRGHLPQAGPSSKLQLKNAAHGNKSELFLHIYIFLVLRGHLPQAGPSSKLQLKNAAHTLATLEIFAKSVTPFALSFRLHNYEQVPIVQCKATADR